MIDQDEAALNLRLKDVLGTSVALVADNKNSGATRTTMFCRWVIDAGESVQDSSDGTWSQDGVAILQIIAPGNTGTKEANAIRDQFLAGFRGWRSPDSRLWVRRLGVDKFTRDPKDNDAGYLQINCKVFWTSHRKP